MITSKSDLIDEVAAVETITKATATSIVNGIFDDIAHHLRNGGEVRIHSFGTFSVTERKATTGRNPRTGEAIEIPARRTVRFKPAKALGDAVNG